MTLIPMHKSSSAPEQTIPLMIEDLSVREREVLACVAQGLTNDEVACQLGIATGTVKAHLRAIYRKLGVRNRAHALMRVWALEGPMTLTHEPGM